MVGGFGIGDGDKAFDAAGFGVARREELLMFAHRGLQHLGRQRQKGVVDAAHQRHRPFDKACDFGQQFVIGDKLHARGEGKVLRALQDGGLALGTVKHDMGAFEFAGVIVKAGDANAVWRQKAVACGGVAGLQTVKRQRHDVGAALV